MNQSDMDIPKDPSSDDKNINVKELQPLLETTAKTAFGIEDHLSEFNG